MSGSVIIDGIDIYTLGVFILRGGDHGLISFPARKDPVLIDWPDQDGFEISDDVPVFEPKKITINYYLKGNQTNFLNRINEFANLHFVPGNRSIYVREFDKIFSLRFAGITSLKINRGFTVIGEKNARINIDYVMDDPTQFLGVSSQTAARKPDTQVTLDNVDLSEFGIIVKDIYSTAFRVSPKGGIVYASRYKNGQTFTYQSELKKGKQVITISCVMICEDKTAFMSNWNALWNIVAVPSLTIGLTASGKYFKAFYNSMAGFSKRPWTYRAFAEFDLNFTAYEL